MEWQPIETAPTDGRYVLVYIPTVFIPRERKRPERVEGKITCARWADTPVDRPGATVGKRGVLFDELYGGYWTVKKNGVKPLHAKPTHWMPLPEPPNVAS